MPPLPRLPCRDGVLTVPCQPLWRTVPLSSRDSCALQPFGISFAFLWNGKPCKLVSALVFDATDQLKVGDLVVAPIAVDVMNVVTFWYKAVMVIPNTTVQKPLGRTLPR